MVVQHIKIVGMKHSGSTMCMHLIQILVRHFNEKITVHKQHEHKFESDPRPCHYILTVRDVRDTAMSNFFRFHMKKNDPMSADAVHLYGVLPFAHAMMENIRLFYQNMKCLPIIFCYEDFKTDPHRVIHFLIRELFGHEKIEGHVIDDFLKQLEDMRTKENLADNLKVYHQKKQPLLTKDHNTGDGVIGKYKNFFSASQMEIIFLYFPLIKNWFRDHGLTNEY